MSTRETGIPGPRGVYKGLKVLILIQGPQDREGDPVWVPGIPCGLVLSP